MENNYFEQICFDLQLGEQILDEMSQLYVQNTAVQPISDNNYKSNDNNINNKTTEVMAVQQNSPQNYYQTSPEDFHSVPEYDSSNSDKSSNPCDEYYIDIEKYKMKINAKIDDYCMKIIRDMNTIGVCVINNFIEELGEFILQEVIYLYQTVVFSDGRVVKNNIVSDINNEKIRGDSIYWVNGSEPNCKFISILMTTLDKIIFKCNKMNNNGLMGINTISSRTSAMVACYPGQESRYKQHADNTIGDGRYITCIYYINKNWNPINDGGLLRIYPSQVANQQPLNIAPEFDRLICFWSDRRNLHEVLPTKRLRFAITVWYFDEEERKRFRQRINSQNRQ